MANEIISKQNIFIIRAKSIHNLYEEIYDYSQVNYINIKTKVTIKCNLCHQSFDMTPDIHIHKIRGCKECKPYQPLLIYRAIKPLYKAVLLNCYLDNSKYTYNYRLSTLNIIIELDGKECFENIPFYKPKTEMQSIISFKNKEALEKNCSVIRLLYEDVLFDKYDWLSTIKLCVNNLLLIKPFNKIIFVCANNEYESQMVNADITCDLLKIDYINN